MTTDEIALLIQSLQDQIKKQQEIETELRHDLDTQLKHQREIANDNDYLRKKLSAIQYDNSNYGNTQARLETQLYAQEQDINSLRKEIQQLTKAKKDIERKLITESQDYENDRSVWQQREADLYNQIRALSVNNTGEPRTPRTPRRRSVTSNSFLSPFTGGLNDINETSTTSNSATENDEIDERPAPKLAAINSSYARDAKIAQRTIKAQDKLILDLKTEVEKHKSLVQEQQSQAQLQSLKIVHLENEIANVKQLNRSLQEDNESYQILLHEKTMNGEFMMNPIMQVEDNPIMKESSSTSSNGGGLNLAAELASSIPDWNSQKEDESKQTIHKLTEENKTLQDTNRALQLYMNKILMKIIDNKQLEDVLSIDQPSKPAHNTTPMTRISTKSSSLAPEGPQPTKTVSTMVSTKNNSSKSNSDAAATRQRRRTISYWGSKPPPAIPNHANSQQELSVDKKNDDNRRHSSIVQQQAPNPEKSVSTSASWAKALRRMSGIGWASAPKEEPSNNPPVVNNDSAVGSINEEDKKTSGSSTPSLRRSNELGTLDEE